MILAFWILDAAAELYRILADAYVYVIIGVEG